jgi:hypothetical protein
MDYSFAPHYSEKVLIQSSRFDQIGGVALPSRGKWYVLFFVAIFFVEVSVLICHKEVLVLAKADNWYKGLNIYQIDQLVNFSKIMEHVVELSSKGSRMTGYPGMYIAASYIKGELEEYGYTVDEQRYPVAIPLEESANITVESPEHRTIHAHVVWPNGIQTSITPPEGLEGQLIYVGQGFLEDFDGKPANGSIALMDYNSGKNWVNALRLGCKAVIFIEPCDTTFVESLSKFIETPIHLPRLYVSLGDGSYLKRLAQENTPVRVRIHSRMHWQIMNGLNLVAKLEGTGNTKDVVVVATHYDSWSPVPGVSVGANEAVDIAILLEIARFFKQNPPINDMVFVALSGHWEALIGAREFVENYYFDPHVQNGTVKPMVFIDIDMISSNIEQLAIVGGVGHLYRGVGALRTPQSLSMPPPVAGISNRYTILERRFQTHILNQEDLTNFVSSRTGRDVSSFVYLVPMTTWSSSPMPFLLDSEPVQVCGSMSLSITSAFAFNLFIGTPINDMTMLRKDLLAKKLPVVAYIISTFANDINLGEAWSWELIRPQRDYDRMMAAEYKGYVTLNGRVVEFNYSKGWYSPVSHAIVQLYTPGEWYPFAIWTTMSDEKGEFIIHGLPFSAAIEMRAAGYGQWVKRVEAWKLDERDGHIIYAPDLGVYGARSIREYVQPIYQPMNYSTAVMRCVSLTLLDPIDPRSLRTSLIPDIKGASAYIQTLGGELKPMDFSIRGEFISYGVSYNGYDPAAMLFVLQNSSLAIMMYGGGQGLIRTSRPIMALVNASSDFPEGKGYLMTKPITIGFTPYEQARDFYLMAKARYTTLSERNAQSVTASNRLLLALEHLNNAELLYKNYSFSKSYAEALRALMWSYQAYSEVMLLVNDTSSTSGFFFFIMIFGSLILERMLFHKEGARGRLLSTIMLGGICTGLFALVHPALTLMANSLMALLALVMIVLFLIVIIIISWYTEKVRKAVSLEILGYHGYESGRWASIGSFFSLSVEHMRKHRFRTVLTLVTIVITASALILFTSTSYETRVRLVKTDISAQRRGLLIRAEDAIPPVGALQAEYLIPVLESVVGPDFQIMPRAWYYPPSRGVIGPRIDLESRNATIQAIAVLGLTPKESEELFKKCGIVGRPFAESDENVVMLANSTARALGINIGDTVKVFDLNMDVVSLYTDAFLSDVLDLDGFSQTPIDPSDLAALATATLTTTPRHLSWSEVIILPYKTALKIGGYVSSIAISPIQEVSDWRIIQIAKELATTLDLHIFVASELNMPVQESSRVTTFSLLGFELILVLLVIGSLSITNTILTSVKERTQEMRSLNAIGLSPTGVIVMHVVETIVYAFIGTLVGYFLGFSIIQISVSLGLSVGDYGFNFASLAILLAFGFVIVASIAGSVYPIQVAVKLANPSGRRKWTISTKPKGDEWEIPVMVKIASKQEILSILYFFREYFQGAGAVGRGFTIDKVGEVDVENLRLEVFVRLAPYEEQITERVLLSCFGAEGGYFLNVYLMKLTGVRELWQSSNILFIDDIRKQLLIWRSLTPEQQKRYLHPQETTKNTS